MSKLKPPSIGTSFTSSSNTGWACTKLGNITAAIKQMVTMVDIFNFTAAPSFRPRFGYSVKFVAVQKLLQEGMATSEDDLEKISH
jgi:hypothetical protein